jgi:hypothetical protein
MLPKWGGSLLFEKGNTEYKVNSTAQCTAGTPNLPYKAKLKLTTDEIQYMLQAIYHMSSVF